MTQAVVDAHDVLPTDLFESLPSPAWVVRTSDRRIEAANAAARRAYGADADDASWFLEDDGPRRADAGRRGWLGARRADRRRESGPRRHRTIDGTVVWVELVTVPLVPHRPDLELVLARDVTELHAADDRLGLLEAAIDSALSLIHI